MAHAYDLRVYYSDTDAGGIVYHARYLDFAEHARTELLRAVSDGRPGQMQVMRDRKLGFVVKSLSIEYHTPAFLDDALQVLTTIESAKRFSVTFLQRIMRSGEELATMQVRVASIVLDSHKPVPFEPWFAEAVATL